MGPTACSGDKKDRERGRARWEHQRQFPGAILLSLCFLCSFIFFQYSVNLRFGPDIKLHLLEVLSENLGVLY